MFTNFLAARRRVIFPYMFLFLIATVTCCRATATSFNNFPLYKAISKNVAFWEKIYSHYSLTEAVIHDSDDLSKIYEVIPLLDWDLPGAAHFNALFQRQAIEKYSTILNKLAAKEPSTRDEIRIAALFPGENRYRAFAVAAGNIRSQVGQKERFLSGVIHSGRYMREIKEIFRAYHLPEELAYLPHVESSFNFKAYSKLGAAGIWQFTRTTGKQYLTIDYTLDERLDPILATRAAAKYLENSYRSLNSWPLAVTSYNYGLAGTVRAMNEEGDYEKVFKNYNKGYFKFASKNFYSEFLAAIEVAKQLEQDPRIQQEQPQSSRYFNLPGYIHIRDAGKRFGISTETLVSLNPALRPPVLSGEKHIPKGYAIRLPAGEKTSRLIASVPAAIYKSEQKPSLFHQVKKGDTAASIARLHGVALESLISANNLDKAARIYIKQKLRIPKHTKKVAQRGKNMLRIPTDAIVQKAESDHNPASSMAFTGKNHHPLENKYAFLPKKNRNVYNVVNIHKKRGKTYGYITVQPEESLGLYSDWLGTRGTVLSALNGFKSGTNIEPGQRLLLVFDKLSPTLFKKKRLAFLRETEEDYFSVFTIIGQKIYQVISGDTLWDLCYNKFDIPLWLLKRYNSDISLTSLNTEQELIVPITQEI